MSDRQRIINDTWLFIISLFAALIMRLPALGQLPLSLTESAEAWAVWRFWQAGDGGLLPVSSPAYFTFTAVVTQFFGHNDAAARLVPALFGAAAAMMPWLLRKRLGTIGAFAAAMLLAVSPLHAITSRTAGGDGIALFALMLLLTAVLNFHDNADPKWQTAAALSAGLGLASSPLFYSGLFALLLALLVQRWADGDDGDDGDERPSPDWQQVGLITAAAFLLSSSLFLVYPAGWGAGVRLPADWFTHFHLTAGLTAFFHPFIILLRYEPFTSLLMAGGLLCALCEDRKTALFFVYWMAAAIFLLLVQQGNADNAVLLTLPSFLLIGLQADRILTLPMQEKKDKPLSVMQDQAVSAAIFLAFGAVILGNTAAYARQDVLNSENFIAIWLAILLVITGTMLAYFLLMWEGETVVRGAVIAILTVTFFQQWGTAWQLSHYSANDPQEQWVTVGTDDGVRVMTAVIHDLSDRFAKSHHGISIANGVDSPILRWYLRDFDNVTHSHTLPYEPTASLLISEVDDGRFAAAYTGADFNLLRRSAQFPPRMTVPETLRWMLFHDHPYPQPPAEKIILWWKIE